MFHAHYSNAQVHERDFYYYASIFFVIFAVLIAVVVLALRDDIRKSIDLCVDTHLFVIPALILDIDGGSTHMYTCDACVNNAH